MPPIVVRVQGLIDKEWNAFARAQSPFLLDLIERYDAQLEMRLAAQPGRDGQFVMSQMTNDDITGWFELSPRDADRADGLARELADRLRSMGRIYAHAVVEVCVVRFRVHHSYGGGR